VEAVVIFNRHVAEDRVDSTSMQNVSRLLVSGLCKVWHLINNLKTKGSLLYLKTQFVPRSKHFSYPS